MSHSPFKLQNCSNLQSSMESLTVSTLKSQMEEISFNYNNTVQEKNVLTKELGQWKKDYGDLLLINNDTQQQLAESRTECRGLRERLARENLEFQRFKEENDVRIRDEIKMLREKNSHLTEENGNLEGNKKIIEEELKNCTLQCENLRRKCLRLEKQRDEAENQAKKVDKEFGALMAAASARLKDYEKRVSDLETATANLSNIFSDSAQITLARESFGPETLCEGLGNESSHGGPVVEEKTASSLPSPRMITATQVKIQALSFNSDQKPAVLVAQEKSASSIPSAHKSLLTSPFVYLSSSDDDGELPSSSSKGLKRKFS